MASHLGELNPDLLRQAMHQNGPAAQHQLVPQLPCALFRQAFDALSIAQDPLKG
ncbi:MAG: hypothetical protein Q9210_000417 [Variospora velana]